MQKKIDTALIIGNFAAVGRCLRYKDGKTDFVIGQGGYLRLPRRKTMWDVAVDKEKCTGCEECVGNCPASVLELIDGKSEPVSMDDCLGCETCMGVCEAGAITVSEI